MHGTSRGPWVQSLVLIVTCFLPVPGIAHPGSGIVVDRLGQVYFVDMVSGVWKLDAHGALTHIRGPAFHWMTLDAGDRFKAVRLPSAGWEIARIGTSPTLLLASSFPIAMGRDGNLYYPSHGLGTPLQLLKLLPSGQTSSVSSLTATTPRGPLRDLNGLAVGPDGSLYYTENAAIRRIGREGRVTTVVEDIALPGCTSILEKGGRDGPLFRGLDVDVGGTIYVAATACGSVFKVTPSGQVTLLQQVQHPWSPTGVALFGNDLYVLEFQNAQSDDRREMLPRVRKIGPDGKTAVIATVTRH